MTGGKQSLSPLGSLARRISRRALRLLPSRVEVPRRFHQEMGRPLDLSKPVDLCSKLNWMKLNYVDDLMIDCSDKILVRDYAKAVLGEDMGVPILQRGLKPQDVTPETITAETFVLKVNHDSGGVLVCRDRARFDWQAARRFMAQRMRNNFYWEGREATYRPLRPEIFVEECLPETPEAPLLDYKLWCFGGEVKFVQITVIEHGDGVKRAPRQQFLALDWSVLPVRRAYPIHPGTVSRPVALDRMIALATRLSQPFALVRVDLFQPSGTDRLYLGELTFCPSSGLMSFQPEEFDREAGTWIRLPAPVDVAAVLRGWHPGKGIEAFRKSVKVQGAAHG